MGKKKKTAPDPVIEPKTEEAPTVINVNNAPKINLWKAAFLILVVCWCFFGVKGCIQEKFADWKQGIIDRLVPSPVPDPFRERRTRPDKKDKENDSDRNRRGIIWRFTEGTSAGAKALAGWVKANVPKDAKPSAIYDVADAFYDAADLIAKQPQIDEPNEAVAAARLTLFGAADPSWVPFLTGLDEEANTFNVKSIDDVTTFYYAVAGALYDAASAVSAAAVPSEAEEPGQLPPSDQAALPPPAEPAVPETAAAPEKPTQKVKEPEQAPAKTAQNCPDGSCPNNGGNCPDGQCPNNGYGYNYGWRWF